MPTRDFFAFCTSLSLADRKTLGQLSSVRHLETGKTLYSPGDPGDGLYIVNRGTLEVLLPNELGKVKENLLERGDVVGAVEAFDQSPRTQLIRARDAVSLQCFSHANLKELLLRLPAFFYFLSEQLALRLQKERGFAGERDGLSELGGRLSSSDLTTIHQAIISSGKKGELTMRNDDNEVMGAFYFGASRILAGWFQHLTGEEAFWQMFQIEKLSGSFTFAAGDYQTTDGWLKSRKIDRNDTALLLTSLQYRDELSAFKESLGQSATKIQRVTNELKWTYDDDADLRRAANRVWDCLAHEPMTIEKLYRAGDVCEHKTYKIVAELLRSKHVASTRDQSADIPGASGLPQASSQHLNGSTEQEAGQEIGE